MKTKNNPYVALIALFLSLLVASCSSTPQASIYKEDSVVFQETRTLDQRFATDRGLQIDVLSPNHFKNAEKKLNEAKKKTAKNDDSKSILTDLGDARTHLDLAESTAQKTTALFPDLLGARADSIRAEAPRLVPNLWKKAEESFTNITEHQERKQDAVISSEDRKETQEKYVTAQTEALKVKYLSQIKSDLKTIENEHGEKLIPSSFQESKNKISAAEGVIEGNRNDTHSIEVATENARLSVTHSRELLDRAKTVKSGSPEQVANDLLVKDVRNQSLHQDLHATESSLAQTELERQELAKKNGTQRYIANLQSRFKPDEADVFQQGNNVLIRLKGLKFKSGNTDIPSKSVSLLEEVKNAIKENPDSTVMVEGHTDAVGGANANLKLSQKRADSIKEYLAKDNTVPPSKIIAKGYGFEKPVTNEKTAEGRAQNRRVDIIIENIDAQHPKQ